MSAPAPPPRKNRQTPEGGSRELYPNVEKGTSGMGVPRKLIERDYSVSDFAETPRTAREKLPAKTESILNAVADAIVGADVEINGEIEFDKLIRIEGKFEGKLVTNVGGLISIEVLSLTITHPSCVVCCLSSYLYCRVGM
jgi:hypothetical protein